MENEKWVKSKEWTLGGLLLKKKYRIDFYQREYVWETKQIADLVNDLTSSFLDQWKLGQSREKVAEYDPYFLGEIVVSTHEGESSLIDGQQRLSSITLLLIYLLHRGHNCQEFPDLKDYIYTEKYAKKSFNLDIDEREDCMRALLNDGDFSYKNDDDLSVRNLVERYHDIADLMPDEIKDDNIAYFTDWLTERVFLSQVETNNDAMAYVIFETMNDRGLSLTPVEMLKSFLLANITDKPQRDEAQKEYEGTVSMIRDIKPKAEFDFFKMLFRSHFAEDLSQKGQTDFVRIGNEFHRWVSDSHLLLGLEKSEDYSRFVNLIAYFGRCFAKILEKINARDTKRDLYLIVNDDLGFTLQPALIMAGIAYGDTDEVVDEKIKLISKYLSSVLFKYIWNSRLIAQSYLEAPIYDLCKEIRDCDTDDCKKILEKYSSSMDMQFSGSSIPELNQQNKKRFRLMLAMITEYVTTESGRPSVYNDIYKNEIEHVWADHFEEHLDEFKQETDFSWTRNYIGDLLLLPKDINQSYGDQPYEKKVEMYLSQNLLASSLNGACYETGQGYVGFQRFMREKGLQFKSYDVFDRKAIDERCLLYCSILEKIWE